MKSLLLSIVCTCLLSSWGFAQKHVQISHLKGNLYQYITWSEYKGASIPANAMYIVTTKGVVIIDTPWDTTQIQPLNDSIMARHHQPVIMVIATHHHGDRAGGFDIYKRMGIKTYSSELTYTLNKEYKEPTAAYRFTKDTTFNIGGEKFQTFYPGEGHTKDNIVIWFGKEQVLFGGCFVKGMEAETAGYIGEANLKAWPASVARVKKAFPNARIVIAGHEEGTSPAALDHTSQLARDQH